MSNGIKIHHFSWIKQWIYLQNILGKRQQEKFKHTFEKYYIQVDYVTNKQQRLIYNKKNNKQLFLVQTIRQSCIKSKQNKSQEPYQYQNMLQMNSFIHLQMNILISKECKAILRQIENYHRIKYMVHHLKNNNYWDNSSKTSLKQKFNQGGRLDSPVHQLNISYYRKAYKLIQGQNNNQQDMQYMLKMQQNQLGLNNQLSNQCMSQQFHMFQQGIKLQPIQEISL
ncbi:hypothetical protein TTHERM_000263358 (macronuclear) [Tetrahymena thermophila SB210]|uniref:Uncharacterized protein n=1 Tax=Tetrahymena thermophila (strain SB210) TaxID=312017 RepID=W7XK07_TETTS|nr:hypothetical protein TTHERM_000263358 [Tetrahymena thermophila SB210]EWS76111.1 hypothetical protein TTHERM_000263358 [Tetrahymena thermophila SB210]|eukprot:XP_012651351.1 hypothetical protein TTHERM_000263358 [Tetrahymena thermophila SB210]